MRDPSFDRPGLDELAGTDLLLDALAGRVEVALDDPHDDALATLMGEWRDDLRWPPASALVSPDEAVDALIEGIAERRRSRRALAAVGSVAATLLALSGFGALVADARPGDALYGLHAMMFNEPRVSDDPIVLSAKADLAKAEQLIAQGQWDQAETQLAEISSTLQAVNDGSRRQHLLNELNQLNTKVERRDPNATVPPGPSPQSVLSRVFAPGESPATSSAPSASDAESATTSGAPESASPSSPGAPAGPASAGTTPPVGTSETPTSSPAPPTSPSKPVASPSAGLPSGPSAASPTSVPMSPAAGTTEPGSAPAPPGEPG
ncbi:hypothetical protein B1987_20365 [Mycobacterium kansasii]|uniref:Anti-sigma-D factor RsdA n=1 Tax=Mycobacterium attenuatum TaxID=2341086 RepID=A0A498PTQ0_9MYCO|nr:anti-sigma-D factor RsdA [Mycobacterium attenuatum]ORB85751.1 hypothetical protein B1987_20365 [Mycobacterium kansasii]VBA35317.1 Anti-sigma-D factor RsdA [Mycobacterium attenuatum]VBA47946.1 Anti-sigma-D factor RsdA [Mycobacterium attenuatum]